MTYLVFIGALPFGLTIGEKFVTICSKPYLSTLANKLVGPLRKMNEGLKLRDRYFDNLISKKLEDIKNGIIGTDMTTILLQAVNRDGSATFTQREIRAQLYTFLFGGFDTTASVVEQILFHLADQPDWKNKIRNEFEDLGGQVNKSTLKQLTITTAFIREVLRLANVIDILNPRQMLNDIKLPDGSIMPKGCEWSIDIASMGQNHIWGDHPMKFDPSRYLDNVDKMHPYQNIPFSAGKRNCIGRNFAMQEMKIIVVRVASLLKLENHIIDADKDGRPVKKQFLTYKMKDNTFRQKIQLI